jgi:DNA-binding Xre family transcriptional regulator
MIKLQLNKLLGNRSHYWLAQEARIAHSTIRKMATQTTNRISFAVLDKLCDALECGPGDLLIKVPDK